MKTSLEPRKPVAHPNWEWLRSCRTTFYKEKIKTEVKIQKKYTWIEFGGKCSAGMAQERRTGLNCFHKCIRARASLIADADFVMPSIFSDNKCICSCESEEKDEGKNMYATPELKKGAPSE